MSYLNTIGNISTNTTKLTLPLQFPDGTIQTTANTSGGELEYSNLIGTTYNLAPAGNTFSAYGTQALPAGVYLVSFEVSINNLDTAPIDIGYYLNQMLDDIQLLAEQRVQLFTLAPTQIYSTLFSAVAVQTGALDIELNNQVLVNITSGAFLTTAPTLTIRNRTIVKIA